MLKKSLIAIPLLLLAGAVALYFYANREAARQTELLIERALASGAYQEIDYQSVRLGADTSLTISGLSVVDLEGTEYLLDEIVISDFDFLNPFPRHIRLQASGLSFPRGLPDYRSTGNSALDNYLDAVASSGDSIPLTLDYQHQYEPADAHALSSTLGLSLENSASISLRSDIRNLAFAELASAQLGNQAVQAEWMNRALTNAEVPALSLSLEDRGIVDSFLAMQASGSERSVAEVRAQSREMLRLILLFLPEDLQDPGMELIAELRSFLEGGRTFELSLEPEYNGSIQRLQPIVLGAMFNARYAELVEALNPRFNTR